MALNTERLSLVPRQTEKDRRTSASSGSDLISKLQEYRRREKETQWEGTFAEYWEKVVENPKIGQLSHARVYDMIEGAGIEGDDKDPSKPKTYKFFADEIFGLDKTLQRLAEYFNASARRLEVRKRILLLMGPVGGGKSTIVSLLKRGLEEYSRTEEGEAYAIKGCPMQEEPLHLIPDDLRPEIEKKHGIHIEGDLCPACRLMVKEHDGKIEDVKVERLVFSEKNRKGIGTFSPSDPKSQDISELTGSIDLSTIGEYGVESDPRAYRFDGELNVANRGIMEFIEMLKCDEKFLYSLLTLSQEQSIKTGRFAMIYADEVLASHTNENEYNAFIGDKKKEALHDRIILIKVPYNLRVSDEIKIYEKLLAQSGLKDVHIAPNTLRIASVFAILSRLEESKKSGMSLVKKLKLYDGESVGDFNEKDVKELQDEAKREGMDGISPRYIINRLSNALIKDGTTCINPIDTLRALKDGLESYTTVKSDDRERYLKLITEARKEYDEIATRDVQKAFVYSFADAANNLVNNYLDNIEAYCTKTKLKDPVTGDNVEPDEKLMRSIEEQVGIGDPSRKAFREEILISLSTLARKGGTFSYNSNEKLREAIEKKLFSELKDVIKITTSIKTPDEKQRKKIAEVIDRLVKEGGYCSDCAGELIKYVGSLLNR